MVATVDPEALSPEPPAMWLGLLERNRSVLQRAARVMRAASNLEWIAASEDPLVLRTQLAAETRLLACDGADLELVLGWVASRFPRARVAAWSHDPSALIAHAEHDDRLVSLLGWPGFQSMPRVWELALATRTILDPWRDPTALADVFVGAPAVVELRPRSPGDREVLATRLAALVERVGAAERVSARIGEVAHELIMNATYDAPITESGEPRYAHDRRAPVVLSARDAPVVRFATDGTLVALQVTDRFGRLSRDHVLASIRRGQEAQGAASPDVVDRSSGGAGLGLWRVHAASAVTIVDILPGSTTSITAVFDLDLGPREARTLPPSLHLFDRGRLG